MLKRIISVIIAVFMLAVMAGFGAAAHKLNVSDVLIGEWAGEYDVAPIMYDELIDELGFDVALEPVYASIYMTFNEDGTCVMSLDANEFADAVGEIVEPYVSGIFGFDTDFFIDMVMQGVAGDLDPDSYTESGVYYADEETGEIMIEGDDGSVAYLQMRSDLTLEFEDADQTIIMEKIS